MKSSIINISEILNSANNFISAGFSKGYNFDREKATSYFDELMLNSKSNPVFSGILIVEKSEDNYVIIDGLQRIITINLLFCALCQHYMGTTEKNQEAVDKILDRFLIYKDQPKLKLDEVDNTVFEKIVLSKKLTKKDKKNNLFLSYDSFLDKIVESKVSGNYLFESIAKMQFMLIVTDKSEISARELYQVLNNKGESQLSLISDFVAQQGKVARELWKKTEDVFIKKPHLFEVFIRDLLTTRLDGDALDHIALYNNFKNYYHTMSKYQDTKTLFENIHKYALYYFKIITSDFENPEIKKQIVTLNRNNGRDTYPYLMEVLDDLENGHITESAFLNILMMINSFVKNRKELTVNDVGIDFATLSRELNKMLVLKDYVPDEFYENKLTINEINNLVNFEV